MRCSRCYYYPAPTDTRKLLHETLRYQHSSTCKPNPTSLLDTAQTHTHTHTHKRRLKLHASTCAVACPKLDDLPPTSSPRPLQACRHPPRSTPLPHPPPLPSARVMVPPPPQPPLERASMRLVLPVQTVQRAQHQWMHACHHPGGEALVAGAAQGDWVGHVRKRG